MKNVLIEIGKKVLNVFLAIIMLFAIAYLYVYELHPIYLPRKNI